MEETIVIECSRQSSIEGTTGNYQTLAEWTCDCGNGIVLDIGDKIQVHSGFVSEKGAQAGEIEIKERKREDYQVVVSKDIEYSIPSPVYYPPSTASPVSYKEIYDYQVELAGNETRTILVNDGETNIVYSPYKTSNGEYYATLPRRHIGWNTNINAAEANPYETFDCNFGNSTASNLGACVVGNVKYGILDGGNPAIDFNFTNAWQFCPADYKILGENTKNFYPLGAHDTTERKGMILNDNSRYTIFRAKLVYRSASAAAAVGGSKRALLGGEATNTGGAPGTAGYQDAYDLRDPALLYDFDQVKNLLTISSKEGFNSPLDVSVEITEQMNKRGPEIKKKIVHMIDTNTYIEKTLYKYFESPCCKFYNCATSLWDVDAWNAFKKVQNSTDEELDLAHFYMSQYQHIGVKRPELFVQGRETNPPGGFIKPATSAAGGNTPHNSQVLNLGLLWTQANLDKLTNLFDVEAKYPELFTDVTQQGPHSESPKINHPITPGYHRFLHFNGQDDETTSAYNASGYYRHNPKASLGYDRYGQESAIPSTGFYKYDYFMSSYPVFFDYNASSAHLTMNDVGYCEDSAGGVSDINDLAYGWARKVRISADLHASGVDVFYIGIQFTRTGNGVPEFLYNGLSHIALSAIPGNTGRRWGFDHHFSAYGNPCMILYSGLVNYSEQPGELCGPQFDFIIQSTAADNGDSERRCGALYHTLMLGADSPALGYDTNEDRFFFTNLHISEKKSNLNNAGSVTPSVGANTDSELNVIKINKRMLGNSYCPNVAPYTETLSLGAHVAYPAQVAFSNNLEPFTPYDSTSGIFLEEVAVPENTWSENLIGVLGFYYSQFHNDDISRQITITGRLNSSNMKSLTTQANLQVDDLRSWTKNGFGNSIFGLTPGLSYLRKDDGGVPDKDKNLIPPVEIILPDGQDSTRITAVDLPTKTARPYYAIRSDIIPQSQFLGGNQDLTKKTSGAVNRPVVAIINKTNGYGDFYSAEFNMLMFTNTQKRVITQIKTSIHDPDGSYAKVDKSSSVIYKIIKEKQIDMRPVQTLLESKKKNDILIAQTAASMIQDPANAKPNYNYTFNQ